MAPSNPSSDVRFHLPPRARLLVATFSAVGVSALLAAPVAALSLWLLLTDPNAAAPLMERGDALPLMRSLLLAVGEALVRVFAFL